MGCAKDGGGVTHHLGAKAVRPRVSIELIDGVEERFGFLHGRVLNLVTLCNAIKLFKQKLLAVSTDLGGASTGAIKRSFFHRKLRR